MSLYDDYWSEHIQLSDGHFRGRAIISRTPKGYAVKQLEWWHARGGQYIKPGAKVGSRCFYRWVRSHETAERIRDRRNSLGRVAP